MHPNHSSHAVNSNPDPLQISNPEERLALVLENKSNSSKILKNEEKTKMPVNWKFRSFFFAPVRQNNIERLAHGVAIKFWKRRGSFHLAHEAALKYKWEEGDPNLAYEVSIRYKWEGGIPTSLTQQL